MEKKITKRDNFATLRELVLNCVDLEAEQDRLLAFIDHEVEQLDRRAASAKKYAKKATKATDELANAVLEVVSAGDALDIPTIVEMLKQDGKDATPQKVTYRLTKMVEDGIVTREVATVKEEGKASRKVCQYKAVSVEAETETEADVEAE